MNPQIVGKLKADRILKEIGMTNGKAGIDKDEVSVLREKINNLRLGNSGIITFSQKVLNTAKGKENPVINVDTERACNKYTLEYLEKALEELEKKYGIPKEKNIIYV